MPLRISTTDGNLLDVVSLVDGKLEFQTGEAEDLFRSKQSAANLDDKGTYKYMSGWSNGYITSKEGKATWLEQAGMGQ